MPTVALAGGKAGTDQGTTVVPTVAAGIPEGFRPPEPGRAAPRGAGAQLPGTLSSWRRLKGIHLLLQGDRPLIPTLLKECEGAPCSSQRGIPLRLERRRQ